MADDLDQVEYAAAFMPCDTKNFYIPCVTTAARAALLTAERSHTRKRRYMVAVSRPVDAEGKVKPKAKSVDELLESWKAAVKSLMRPASVPVEAMLLAYDDPKIVRVRNEFEVRGTAAAGRSKDVVDWGRCEDRHDRARHEEKLGQKRPYTDWQDGGGGARMRDGAWGDYAAHGQGVTERVYDLIDVNYLRVRRRASRSLTR